MRYAVIFEKAAQNWAAYVPDLPGCVTTGTTLEDTRKLIREAIAFHIEGLRLHGEPVPEPSTVADTVEVAVTKPPEHAHGLAHPSLYGSER